MPIKKTGMPPQIPANDPQPLISPVPAEVSAKPSGSSPLGTYDSVKDRRISRAGIYQAALQSQGVMVHNSQSFEQYLAGVRRAADEGVKYINE